MSLTASVEIKRIQPSVDGIKQAQLHEEIGVGVVAAFVQLDMQVREGT